MATEVGRSEELVDKGVLLGEIDRRTMTDVEEEVVHAKMCSQAGAARLALGKDFPPSLVVQE